MFFFDDRNKFNIFRKNKENNVKNSLQNRNRCEKICYRFQNKDELWTRFKSTVEAEYS